MTTTALGFEELAASDDPAYLVRAELLRELLLGRRGLLDPRGVRVWGARIIGRLDLVHVSASVGLELRRCVVADPVTAYDAHLPWLSLSISRIAALFADGVEIDGDLALDGVRITCSHEAGAICLHSARVGGQLDLDDAEVTNNTGPALFADGLRADSKISG